jgi:hypothetical protein
MEPRQPRLLPETLRSSIASPNPPPSHYAQAISVLKLADRALTYGAADPKMAG